MISVEMNVDTLFLNKPVFYFCKIFTIICTFWQRCYRTAIRTFFIEQFPELQFHAMCNFVFVPLFNFIGTPVLRTPVLRKIWSKVVFQNVFPRTAVLERLFKKEKINESSKFNSSKSTMNSPKMTHFEKFKKCGKYKKREN